MFTEADVNCCKTLGYVLILDVKICCSTYTAVPVQLTSQDGRALVNDVSRPNQQDQLHYNSIVYMVEYSGWILVFF